MRHFRSSGMPCVCSSCCLARSWPPASSTALSRATGDPCRRSCLVPRARRWAGLCSRSALIFCSTSSAASGRSAVRMVYRPVRVAPVPVLVVLSVAAGRGNQSRDRAAGPRSRAVGRCSVNSAMSTEAQTPAVPTDDQAPTPPTGVAESIPTAAAATASVSALEPLADPLFRVLLAASVVSNIGTWMQNVGGTWLMTELTPSPVLVALMQTATSLPIFLAGLPAGALADLVDRRRLLIAAQTWMLAVAALLGGLTLLGWMNPWLLLAFTFALGLGSAFNAPAWQAIIPEIAPGRRMPAAMALESAGFNMARAVGPAAGGPSSPGSVLVRTSCSMPRPSWPRSWFCTAGGALTAGATCQRNDSSGRLEPGCDTLSTRPSCARCWCALSRSCCVEARSGRCCRW